MKASNLIELLNDTKELGDLPVYMTWSHGTEPGPIVAVDIHPDRIELRCERIGQE